MSEVKHLWEVEHSYYCEERNYYSNDTMDRYESWQEFIDERGLPDMDLALVFRWDWQQWDEDNFADWSYRFEDRLMLYCMAQRKGIFFSCEILVTKADEPAIREWLMPRWEHLRKLWEPLS